MRVIAPALLAGCLAGNASAQDNGTHAYLIQFTATLDAGNQKVIDGALREQDPMAQVSVSNASLQAKFRSSFPLDEDQLAARLAPHGIHIAWAVTTSSPEDASDPRSIEISPDAGSAAIMAAKAAWVEEHPGAHPARDASQATQAP